MMVKRLNRRVAVLVLAAGAFLFAAPVLAATSPGTIQISSPTLNSVVSGQGAVEWTWRSGSVIRSTSRVVVERSHDGYFWTKLGWSEAITQGSYPFDTTELADGPVALRITINRTKIRSGVITVLVDNTQPTVRITRPSEGQILVDDEEAASLTVVAGRTTLEAEVYDFGSGAASVTWLLDGRTLGTTGTSARPTGWVAQYTHDFSSTIGRATLTALASDAAGNTVQASIEIVGAAGPSYLSAVPVPDDLPEAPDPGTIGEPDPGTLPDPGTTPDPGTLPEPDPSELPVPDDGGEPSDPPPLPDPTGEIPDPGLP